MSVIKEPDQSALRGIPRQCRGHRGAPWSTTCAPRPQVSLGGGEAARAKHAGRGKLLARPRQHLLDPGTGFLEVGQMAAFGMYDNDAPSAGVITGIGRVQAVECMIVANDATVKGGTYYPMTVKKHLRAQEIAEQNNLPCIYLVDSGGAFLPKQDEVFRIATTSAASSTTRQHVRQGHPADRGGDGLVHRRRRLRAGDVGRDGDRQNQGTIFLGGPPLVKAATGEVVTAEDLGGGDVHTRISGVADHLAEDDRHALYIARRIVANLNRVKSGRPTRSVAPKEPAYDPEEIYGIIPERHPQALRRARDHRPHGRRLALRRVQGALRHHLVCGFAQLYGYRSASSPTTASCSANRRRRARTSSNCATSAASRCCSCRTSPASWSAAKYENGGIAKDGAKMVTAVATVQVPKITTLIGGSFGAGNYGMCGRAYSPRFLWMWPNSRISVMGGEQAASVLSTVRRDGIEGQGGVGAPEEELQGPDPRAVRGPGPSLLRHRADVGRRRGRPAQTRRVLGLSLSASLNAPIQPQVRRVPAKTEKILSAPRSADRVACGMGGFTTNMFEKIANPIANRGDQAPRAAATKSNRVACAACPGGFTAGGTHV